MSLTNIKATDLICPFCFKLKRVRSKGKDRYGKKRFVCISCKRSFEGKDDLLITNLNDPITQKELENKLNQSINLLANKKVKFNKDNRNLSDYIDALKKVLKK
ncbi:MAG: hypothetical protein NT007_00905 [Candidatus Kapabacteria bacterium]|nr:hypothetical protein [Candidatus Kapabacteria bacterium]